MKRLLLAVWLAAMWLTGATPLEAKKVYLLSSSNAGIDSSVKTVLENLGHQVAIGVTCQNFNGSQSLAGYDAVLFLNSSNYTLGDMPAAGQVALSNFVIAGHGLITGAWFNYNLERNWFNLLAPANPADSDGGYSHNSPITYTAQDPEPVLNQNVKSPFTFNATSIGGTEENIWAKTGAKTFYDSSNLGAGLVGWRYGLGRVLNFSTLIETTNLQNLDYQRLLSNAVTWAATPVPPAATRIYIFSGGYLNQDLRLKQVLEGLGHQADLGVRFHQFDGAINLEAYQVLILLASNYGSGDMPAAGQTALLNLVSSGRRLITGEWTVWCTYVKTYFQILKAALPAMSDGIFSYTSPITYRVGVPDSVLNFKVPSPFTFNVTNYQGTEGNIWPSSAAGRTFYDSTNLKAGLVGWTYGRGSVLNFSTTIGPAELDNPIYRQLLGNAIGWRGSQWHPASMNYLLLD